VAGLGVKLSLVGLVVLAGFAVYLDAVVQEKFSGKRWTIPAKVYARRWSCSSARS
jgi:penicillin-binding protein 1B